LLHIVFLKCNTNKPTIDRELWTVNTNVFDLLCTLFGYTLFFSNATLISTENCEHWTPTCLICCVLWSGVFTLYGIMASQAFIKCMFWTVIFRNKFLIWKWCSDIRANRLQLFFGGIWTESEILWLELGLVTYGLDLGLDLMMSEAVNLKLGSDLEKEELDLSIDVNTFYPVEFTIYAIFLTCFHNFKRCQHHIRI